MLHEFAKPCLFPLKQQPVRITFRFSVTEHALTFVSQDRSYTPFFQEVAKIIILDKHCCRAMMNRTRTDAVRHCGGIKNDRTTRGS